MKANIIFMFCLVLSAFGSKRKPIQCKDESGKIVDWYVMYKLPKIHESNNPLIKEGEAYVYMTNYTVGDGWKLSGRSVASDNSIPGQTLAPLYRNNLAAKSAWILYNDQPPNNKTVSVKYGHSKGIVMANDHEGFWLIHSVPNYPPMPQYGLEKKCKYFNTDECDYEPASSSGEEYGYPGSGKSNGQSFLCISVGSTQIPAIAQQLIYNQIISYKYNVPKTLPQYTIFMNASRHQRIKKPPFINKAVVQSVGGNKFISFAKTDKWDKDLYDDFVAPQLNSDLLAETWLNGRGRLPSECKGSKVYNVQSVELKPVNIEFKSSRDHSKWAVAVVDDNNKNWVCIGDINRAETQFHRGGGTVCINSPDLWKNYRSSVNDIEPCPKKKSFLHSVKSWFTSIQI